MLNAATRDRELLGERSIDIRFDEYMADDLGTVGRIYELADQPLDGPARDAMADYVATHERDRFGKVIYDTAQLGLDVPSRRAAMRGYSERFGIPDEPW